MIERDKVESRTDVDLEKLSAVEMLMRIDSELHQDGKLSQATLDAVCGCTENNLARPSVPQQGQDVCREIVTSVGNYLLVQPKLNLSGLAFDEELLNLVGKILTREFSAIERLALAGTDTDVAKEPKNV